MTKEGRLVTYREGVMRAKLANFSGYVECSALETKNLEKLIYVAIDSASKFQAGEPIKSPSISPNTSTINLTEDISPQKYDYAYFNISQEQ